MTYKEPKTKFVYTLFKLKKTKSKLIRINPEIERLIALVNKENNETAFIHKAIIAYLFRNGLRLVTDEGIQYFRVEASKPYVKNHCKNCWYVKNW
ncbi:MAG: hypothetical protein ABIJ40_05995 [Bacteroidota bacterium]